MTPTVAEPLLQLNVDVLVGAVHVRAAVVVGMLLAAPVTIPQVIDWPMLPMVCTCRFVRVLQLGGITL